MSPCPSGRQGLSVPCRGRQGTRMSFKPTPESPLLSLAKGVRGLHEDRYWLGRAEDPGSNSPKSTACMENCGLMGNQHLTTQDMNKAGRHTSWLLTQALEARKHRKAKQRGASVSAAEPGTVAVPKQEGGAKPWPTGHGSEGSAVVPASGPPGRKAAGPDTYLMCLALL